MTYRIASVLLLVGAMNAPVAGQPAARAASTSPAPHTRHPEEGRPTIRNYEPLEFGLTTQNWALAQDARGVIYVGPTPASRSTTGFHGA